MRGNELEELSNKQTVCHENWKCSVPLTLHIDLPQRAVLGPVLCITCIKTLTSMTFRQGVLHASGTTVVFGESFWDEVAQSGTCRGGAIIDWLDKYLK